MKNIFAILIILISALLIWAPWFSKESAYSILKKDEQNVRVCNDYKPGVEFLMPMTIDEIIRQGVFGKVAYDCGRQWYVTFWGSAYLDD